MLCMCACSACLPYLCDRCLIGSGPLSNTRLCNRQKIRVHANVDRHWHRNAVWIRDFTKNPPAWGGKVPGKLAGFKHQQNPLRTSALVQLPCPRTLLCAAAAPACFVAGLHPFSIEFAIQRSVADTRKSFLRLRYLVETWRRFSTASPCTTDGWQI